MYQPSQIVPLTSAYRSVLFIPFLLIALVRSAAAQESEATSRVLRTDSRAPYVHRLSLYDRDGKSIDPSDPEARPYSPRATCGKCHAYAEISCGWHFSAGAPNDAFGNGSPADGRPGEPWIFSDAPTGTRIPLSLRKWDGAFEPADIGMTPWRLAKTFGRHHTGGGILEPDEKTAQAQPEAARWKISGPLEIDCMTCHARGAEHDPAEIERQIERENFQWAPTAALGLAVIRGDAKSLPDEFDPTMPQPPDRSDLKPPQTVYEKSKFDGDNRVLFDMARKPTDERCTFCHSARWSDRDGSTSPFRLREDVHSAAGIGCSDCHGHGLNHRIERGQPFASPVAAAGAAASRSSATMSCRGCHMENPGGKAAAAPNSSNGRFGAPMPEHCGVPPLHFEELSCTICHSGHWPTAESFRVQTSLAHGLGLGSKDRTPHDEPEIREPIYARATPPPQTAASGPTQAALSPYRALWPAYWASEDSTGALKPLTIDAVNLAARKALGIKKSARAGSASSPALTGEQIKAMLEGLALQTPDRPTLVYVRDGSVWRLDADGKLAVAGDSRAQPYLWPVAHDVRPARQALGARGCTDCHADGAWRFARAQTLSNSEASEHRTAASRPGATVLAGPSTAPAWRAPEYSKSLWSAWNRAFSLRDAFKWIGFAAVVPLLLVVLAGLLSGIAAPGLATTAKVAVDPVEAAKRDYPRSFWNCCAALAAGGLFAATLVEAATGFLPAFFTGSPRGWTLLLHVVVAPLFIVAASALAVCWARRPRTAALRWRDAIAWLTLACGLVTILTMLMAMLPLLGTAMQRELIAWHARSSAALLIFGIVWIVVALPRGASRPSAAEPGKPTT